MSSGLESKLARLEAGEKPRVLDLFAGCGGLSLGFQAAGFDVVAAVESDPDAARSHGLNFHYGAEEHSRARDICSSPEELTAELHLGTITTAVDVIVGGPPCQAFARVGRPKLREIEDHPKAFIRDPRARLYLEWLNYVDAFKPLAVLMENVPDIVNHGGQNVAQEICGTLERKGYICGYTLLNAAYYGVPQMRERMFLVGYRREIASSMTFPEPSHWIDLPRGYEGSRAVALKLLRDPRAIRNVSDYIPPVVPGKHRPPAITVREAIGDLPSINARDLLAKGKLKRGPRHFDTPMTWDQGTDVSPYAQHMRNWSGFKSKNGLLDHVIRYLPRDYRIFERMSEGEQYPEAHQHARELLEEHITELANKGHHVIKGSDEYDELFREYVPPYDPSKFPNKWRKMWQDAPARTLMAHLGKDSYSHIHFDSAQARPISVREAARLQSFPDGFVFSGAMNSAFRQIGNAVPPLLAKALAKEMRKTIVSTLGTKYGDAVAATKAG